MSNLAIIGGGFTGSMLATHILRQASGHSSITLIERHADRPGGVAYRTRHLCHVLNVPVGRMSAFPSDPDHFTRWLAQRVPHLTAASFAPRSLYGDYVGEILSDAARSHAACVLRRVIGQVIDLRSDHNGVTLRLHDGTVITASRAAIAIGNFPPAALTTDPAVLASTAYVADPWQPGGLSPPSGPDVLIVGTGLTMLDAALALDEGGFRGRITAISRRGLLPQPHRHSDVPHAPYELHRKLDSWPSTALGMLRALRDEVRHAEADDVDWREVVTALRAGTPTLWQRLDAQERARFLEHLRPFWETHRHRSAPEVHQRIDAMMNAGRLRIVAARLARLSLARDRIDVHVRLRSGTDQHLLVDRVINCIGPETDLRRVPDPLIRSACDGGLIRADSLGLGLDAKSDGRLIDVHGQASDRLFLAGPLRKGRLWENTAVPELRVEVQRLADTIIALGRASDAGDAPHDVRSSGTNAP